MERDFMGLSSKEPLALVKEEVISDGFKELGFSKGSGSHWPFPNKVSAVPNLIPFKVTQEKTKRVATDSLVSPGLLSLSTVDPFEITKKPALAEVQKSLNHERGNHFTAYGMQHSNEVETFPVPNSMSMSNPFFKNHYTRPQSLSTPQPIRPTAGYVAGITDLCSKPCSSPAQLTIFYAGTVNVYDSISPEKAQAIMLSAGNGSPITQPKIQVEEPTSKAVVATDSSPIPRPISTSPSSRLSSPLSGSGSTSTEDILAAKTTGTPSTPIAKVGPPKVPINAPTLIPSAVPQARKASLARFLEKRKERAMNSAPYNLSKKSDGMDIHL